MDEATCPKVLVPFDAASAGSAPRAERHRLPNLTRCVFRPASDKNRRNASRFSTPEPAWRPYGAPRATIETVQSELGDRSRVHASLGNEVDAIRFQRVSLCAVLLALAVALLAVTGCKQQTVTLNEGPR